MNIYSVYINSSGLLQGCNLRPGAHSAIMSSGVGGTHASLYVRNISAFADVSVICLDYINICVPLLTRIYLKHNMDN